MRKTVHLKTPDKMTTPEIKKWIKWGKKEILHYKQFVEILEVHLELRKGKRFK